MWALPSPTPSWWGMGWTMSKQYRNLPYVGILKPSVYQR